MKKTKTINKTLAELGETFGLTKYETIKAKKTLKNMLAMTIFTAMFIILGHLLMPGGPVGLYYTGGSIKDFRMLFGGVF